MIEPGVAELPTSTPASFSSIEASAENMVSLASAVAQSKLAAFCKTFCFDHRKTYRCTVDEHWGTRAADAPLCDWGNATYLWMIEDLAGPGRLDKLRAKGVASLEAYWRTVVKSLPFWERFKDWRFQRRIRVPAYIKAIDDDAHRIFWLLCDGDTVPNMAQRLGRAETEVTHIVASIHRELHKRGRAHLLETRVLVSLTRADEDDDAEDQDFVSNDLPLDEQIHQQRVNAAYRELSWQEQWIIDAMVVDGLSARDALTALVEQQVSLDGATTPDALNVQHVYYFLRKTLAKLRAVMVLDPEVAT